MRDGFGIAPKQIVEMSQGTASDTLLDVVGMLDREGKNGHIADIVMPLKSWMSWNGVEIARRIKIPLNLRRRASSFEVEVDLDTRLWISSLARRQGPTP